MSRFIEAYKVILKSAYLNGFDLKRKKADNYYMIKKYFELVRILIFISSCVNNIDRLLIKSLNMVLNASIAIIWTRKAL